MDNQAISAATTADILGLHSFLSKPEVASDMVNTYGIGLTFTYMLMYGFAGRDIAVAQNSYETHAKNFFHRVITVGSTVNVGASPGDSASFTLDSGDIDSKGYYYPRAGFSVHLGNSRDGYIMCRIKSVTASAGPTVTIVIEPNDVTKTISATFLYVGAVIPIGAYQGAIEGSGVAPATTGFEKFTHYCQIFRESVGYGGMEAARQRWSGNSGLPLIHDDFIEANIKLDLQKEMAIMFGEETTNTDIKELSVSNNGAYNQVYTTKGLWTHANEYGYPVNYNDVDGFTLSKFNTIAEYLITKGITSKYVGILHGDKFYNKIEDGMLGQIQGAAGGLNSLFTPEAGSGDKNLEIGFRHIKKAQTYFVFVQLPIMCNDYYMGNSATWMRENALAIPMEKVTDAQTHLIVPNVSLMHVQLGEVNRKDLFAIYGGLTGAERALNTPSLSSNDYFSAQWFHHGGLIAREQFKYVPIAKNA
ncbi:MAG: hypothetical protein WC998_08405 [Candidatus Paceibacterota bacterium]|jgi:hypothetical protein